MVANVREEMPVGWEAREAAMHFSPGEKVYCYRPLWRAEYEMIKVIGRHRGSNEYVERLLHKNALTNFRVQLVYNPCLLESLSLDWDGTRESIRHAEELVALMTSRNRRSRIAIASTPEPAGRASSWIKTMLCVFGVFRR
jgi:hypothetical protein